MSTIDDGYARPGIGLISVGWMGKLHTRAYQAVPQVYPELKIRPRLVHASDTAADRAGYARDVLRYARASTDSRAVLADPDGALSWRFRREEAGSGALGDLLSHVVDLMQYVVSPITEVSSLLSTVYAQRPILPMGSGTHFAVIENGEMGEVENDDYVAALVRFAGGSGTHAAGAVGTLEASRVSVGPQCSLGFEIYGTEGSAIWNFEQMNELRLCLGRGGPANADHGYTTILGNASLGDYGRLQPGPA